jgi:uncharacterized membrane protein (UPF0127 family)
VARAASLLGVALALALAAPAGCAEPGTVPATIAGQAFQLELAADPIVRHRGLGGRSEIPRDGGMLFAFRRAEEMAFVMRDCLVPIDIAFLDAAGRVLAIHTMRVEPARRPGEDALDYEERLPRYASGGPAQFAVETAGGRLAELGLRPGQRVEFDRAAVLLRTR